MRKITICLLLFMSMIAAAQPAAVKKAANAVFTLTTYKDDGSVLATTNGFFITADGQAVSSWTPFNGAARAEVTDANGQRHQVTTLMGANELYDIARFTVDGKAPAYTASITQQPSANSQAYLITRSLKPQAVTISSVEQFMNKYAYCLLGGTDGDIDGAAVVNANGQAVGLAHQSSTAASTVDVRYSGEFQLSGLSVNDPLLRNTKIRLAMPTNIQQAQIALMLAASDNSEKYDAAIQDFIRLFPEANDGYYALASKAVAAQNYALADETLKNAVKKATQKDEAHFNYARLIYQAVTSGLAKEGTLPADWTLDKVEAETKAAQQIKSEPVYDHLLAQVTFTRGNYQQAYDQFMSLVNSTMRNPELYFEAAQCKTQLGASDDEILALLDNAIAVCDTPYVSTSAPYFLARAGQEEKMGQYRKAMLDYFTYEYFNRGNLSADFYYMREQCEAKGKLFQQALNDILIAIRLEPKEPLYYAELANLSLRIGKRETAIEAAKHALELDADYADAHLVLGIALCEEGKKAEGRASIEKAKALGHVQADKFLEKYK